MAIELQVYTYAPGFALFNVLGTPPAAPTGCAAAALSAGINRVTWTDAAEDETAFVVERAPDSGGSPGTWTVIAAAVAADSEQYDDAAAAPGQAYWYRVKARNPAGDSDYSTAGAAVTTKSAPAITWVSPPAGAVPAGIALQVSATATDADDGALAVALEESTDGGETWSSVGASPQIRTVSGDTRWRATATDTDDDSAQSIRAVTVGEAVAGGRPGINRGLITTR